MATPLASNARGMKKRDFHPISRFISETIQDRAIDYYGTPIVLCDSGVKASDTAKTHAIQLL